MRLLAVSDTRLYVVDVSVAAWRGCSALPCCDVERVESVTGDVGADLHNIVSP